MPPRRIYADARVRADAGCVALARGPVVYCVEETDNGGNLAALRLPRTAQLRVCPGRDARLGGVPVLQAEALRLLPGDTLYRDEPPAQQETTLTAVPYYTWGKPRGPAACACGCGNNPARPGGVSKPNKPKRRGVLC